MVEHGSIWITANAGSGKTTFLTRRVVTLLLAGVLPERICCITYTKAAASEMRERVLGQLRQLLLMDEMKCRARVEELLGHAPSAEQMARARTLFGRVLDSASGGVQLTTIHGFCQNILKRFPLEAGIAPHFTVLEDEAATRLLRRVKQQLLREYSAGDPSLDAAFDLIGSRSSEGRFDDYLTTIIQKRRAWEDIWRGQTPDTLRAGIYAAHGLEEGVSEAALSQALCEVVRPDQAAVIRAHLSQFMASEGAHEQHIARTLAAWLEMDAAIRQPLIPDFCLVFLTQQGGIRKNLLKKKEYPENSPLRPVMNDLTAEVAHYQATLAALSCAEESFAVALLARALLTLYAQAKDSAYALDYDDLIGKTQSLLANPAMLGWVMSKLDHRIDHLLIDEAQDTSDAQWQLARALVEELIASNDGVGSGNLPRSLLVVGDEKQSIYSFQGAAPKIFAQMKSQFGGMLSCSAAPLNEEHLTTSYRSTEAVLRLVDHLAAREEMTAALHASGIMHPHHLKREEAAGRVVLYPPVLTPEKEASAPLTLPMEYSEAQRATTQLADNIAATIAGWLEEGRLLESEGRPIAAGDILILVRTRTTLVLSLIRALERRNVPVAGLDRLTLSSHLAVRDLLALMRFVLNPSDDLALAHVLRSPIIGMSDEELRAFCVNRSGSLWAQLDGQAVAAPLVCYLTAREESPYNFLTHVLEVDAARTHFAARFGEEVHEVLDELKQQAAAMPADLPRTLAYFHDWMEGSRREIKREQEMGGGNHVRVMTVHGAKGLEAPVVLLADMVTPPTTQYEKIYFHENDCGQRFPVLSISKEAGDAPLLEELKAEKKQALMEEYYRLFYVALTRARDELHLWGVANKKGNINSASWYILAESSLKQLGAVEENGALVLRDARARQPRKDPPSATPAAPLPTWLNTSPPAVTRGVTRISPSALMAEEEASAYAQSASGNARTRGVIIHRVLELLSAKSDALAVRDLFSLLAPEWTEKDRAHAVSEVMALLRQESWIWSHPSHAELAVSGRITVAGKSVELYGQIDRLVKTADAVVILDYKTGAHVPASATEIPQNYRLQMKAYHALVQQLYPHISVRCAMLWTAAAQLIWCDDVVAATPFPVEIPLVA